MANKRMFSRTVCESDTFLDLPGTSQRLYFFLGLYADDEGFLKNPKSVLRMISATNDDLNMLIFKGFVIPFDSGVIVITHWKLHNTIKNDRFHPTICAEERAMLTLSKSGSYERLPDGCQAVANLDPSCVQSGSRLEPQYSIEEDRSRPRYRSRRGIVENARDALPPPSTPVDEEHDLSVQIADHQHADALIKRYKLPDVDISREALLEDAARKGWHALEDALKSSSLSNCKQGMSVNFYRLFLYPTNTKGGRVGGADPYEGYGTL